MNCMDPQNKGEALLGLRMRRAPSAEPSTPVNQFRLVFLAPPPDCLGFGLCIIKKIRTCMPAFIDKEIHRVKGFSETLVNCLPNFYDGQREAKSSSRSQT